jgi:DNA mismatch repair protein MutS
VVICGKIKSDNNSMFGFDKIVNYLDLEGKCVHNDFEKLSSEMFKLSYQEEVLKKVYPLTGILSKIDYLGLERMPCGLVSYIRLLQFVNNHNENILQKVRVPQIIEASTSLVLSYNSIKQLDVIPRNYNSKTSKSFSLLDLLNNCKTAVGRRYFKERLLCPSNDIFQLNNSYNNIAEFLTSHERMQILDTMKVNLSDIYDLERLFRKIDIATIQPYELGYIMISITKLVTIINDMINNNVHLKMEEFDISQIPNYVDVVVQIMTKYFNINELLKYNNDNLSPMIFQRGLITKLDELYDELNSSKEYVYDICKKLNGLSSQDNIFKVENNDRDGYYLLVTSKRYQEYVKQNKSHILDTNVNTKLCINDLESKQVSHSSTSVKIFHKSFKTISEKIELLTNRMKRMALDEYKKILVDVSQTTSKYSTDITKCLAYIDYYWCCASNAYYNKYSRPEIQCEMNNKRSKSFLRVEELRHPIIEKLNNSIEYVSNSFSLGCEDCDGMLLYGLNSSGKSSLMKSVGIAVLMAQAGMYVACDKLEYYPYDYIFTRIFSSDDIFKGQSTFTKEMMELRGIMKRANSNSLVLGDELCSGTESISALSIVSAGVYTLAQRSSTFIFATHLHDLVSIPLIKQLENVKTYHLSVEYDNSTKVLVYDRKLKSGNGSSLYGLEVCKSLDLDNDFLEVANKVRQGILDIESKIIADNKNNKYNREIYKDKCQVCGEKAIEIHHINEQKNADTDGYLNGKYHKNSKFNLVCLCDKCHDEVHHGDLSITGYKQTSEGVVLDYTKESKTNQIENNDNQDIERDIRELLSNHPNMKRKDIIHTIIQKYNGVEVSQYKIDKILKIVKNK